MKKGIIIAVIVIVIGIGAYMLLRKKAATNTAINTNTGNNIIVTAPAPAYPLVKNGTAPVGTDEYNIISHLNWLSTNAGTWATQTKAAYGFSTLSQAWAFLAISEGKTNRKDVSTSYAGNTNDEVAAWIKKYVA